MIAISTTWLTEIIYISTSFNHILFQLLILIYVVSLDLLLISFCFSVKSSQKSSVVLDIEIDREKRVAGFTDG